MSKRRTGKKSPATLSILPMEFQVGDTFTDEEGEWEVVSRPWVTRGGKMAHATVQRAGDPPTNRNKNWGAHERLAVRRV